MYWSSRLPAAVAATGARSVFSLHDFFLMCARMGQRIDHHGESCAGPSAELCAPCTATFPWGQPEPARRWIRRLTAVRQATGLALDRPMRALQRMRGWLGGGASDSPSAAAVTGDLAPWREAFAARTAAYRSMVDSVDAFVTASRTLREKFVAWGIPAEKIHHVRQGLDSAPFAAIERRPAPRLRLGFVGTLAPHKGLLDLVQAVLSLPADRVQLVVFGRGDQHREYAARCRETARGASNIAFRGWLTREQIPRAYEEIDVLCVPSRWDECAPLTIQEAFMAGAPCVVSGRGGLAELVRDGADGLHARSGDVADWERVLRRLVDEPDLLARLRSGIRPVPSVAEHAAELTRLYAR
jgi:glycosyltransferase involved in cell wall biosynthesis